MDNFAYLKNYCIKKFKCKENVNGTDLTKIKNWVLLLKFLKIFGDAPLTIKPNKICPAIDVNLNTISYDLKIQWFPVGILCIIISSISRLIQLYTVYLSQHQPTYLTSTMSPTESFLLPLPAYLLCVWSILEWISLLITMPSFARFLNNWKNFEELLLEEKNEELDKKLKGTIATGTMAIPLPCITWLVALVNIPVTSTAVIINTYKYFDGNYGVFGIVPYLSIFVSVTHQMISLLEDTKILFMYISVATAIEKIRQRIQEFNANVHDQHVKVPNSGYPSISVGIVKHWQDAHKLIKEQVRLIQSSQGVHEILFLSYLVIILTIQLFLTLSPIFRGESFSSTLMFENLAYLCFGLIRLYLKCHYAEQLTHQENLMVEELLNWKFAADPEVKNFVDSIIWCPTKIVYGSLLTMEKGLFLSIGSQIVTYIIVLLQFQLSVPVNS